MSAKASGAQPNANGSASSRAHHDGSSGRAFTDEQKAAVIRVRRCKATAFYDILGIESEKTTVTENGVKKAYRKQSLLTHPDKNGYEGADEAFKMVSRAFQILSDADKKRQFDQTGGDPDVRGGGGGAAASPFSGFARSQGGGGRGMWEDELSPEDLFRQFFGGGMGGGGFGGSPFGGGIFDSGPGFVFNLGGGPGVRVHQFGGNRPRRRPQAGGAQQPQQPQTATSVLQSLLPLILLFIIPVISSFFSSDSSAARVPTFSVDVPSPPMTQQHISARLRVPYYVRPADVAGYTSAGAWKDLDRAAEQRLLGTLQRECDSEVQMRDRLYNDAQGWFFVDQAKLELAERMEMRSCRRLQSFGMQYR